jgi:ABC-type lipoprotein export system ATPase subunit
MTRGKSVKEIISVILRIILIKLDKRSRNIVILDEPMSGVESDRQIEVCKFLTEICNNFGIQIIIVTHIEQLSNCANKEIKINGNE